MEENMVECLTIKEIDPSKKSTLTKICKALGCDIGDIMEVVEDV